MESTVVKIVENRGLWCVKWQRWANMISMTYVKLIISSIGIMKDGNEEKFWSTNI